MFDIIENAYISILEAIDAWVDYELRRHYRRKHHLRYIRLWLKVHHDGMEVRSMELTVDVGDVVEGELDGHGVTSDVIPDSTIVTMDSNDKTVATAPANVPVPSGGAAVLDHIPLVILGPGSTDITADALTPDGANYHASATLVVTKAPEGLLSVSLTLKKVVKTTPTPL